MRAMAVVVPRVGPEHLMNLVLAMGVRSSWGSTLVPGIAA
jgi:hypothetical protein